MTARPRALRMGAAVPPTVEEIIDALDRHDEPLTVGEIAHSIRYHRDDPRRIPARIVQRVLDSLAGNGIDAAAGYDAIRLGRRHARPRRIYYARMEHDPELDSDGLDAAGT